MTASNPLNPSSFIKYVLVTETFSPEINGVAMTLGKVVHHLVEKQHQVCVVRPRQSIYSESLNEHSRHYDELIVDGIKIPFYRDLRIGLPAKNRLIKAWSLNRPDVVHIATEGPLGWSALKAAQYLKIPVISSYHTNFHQYSECYGVPWLMKCIARYLRYFHNQTSATLAPTRKLITHLSNEGYRNVGLMARGVDRKQFNPSRRSKALRQSWGVAKNDLVVLYVGRLAKEKNTHLVVEAFKKIQLVQPNAKLVFVGDGPLRASLAKACPEAIFAGSKTGEELGAYYASGDLFLFPSVTETFGNVVTEALASGLCVVAYDAAAAADLIEHEISGLLVPFNQPSAFIEMSLKASNDVGLRKVCRTYAELSVASSDWSSVINHLEALLYQTVNASQHLSSEQAASRQASTEANRRLVI